MKLSVYKSCGCFTCRRLSTSARKGYHKRLAHRLFRRRSKAALRRGDETVPIVSTGYVM